MFPVHNDGSVNMLNNNGHIVMPAVSNVRHRLPDAEQQQNHKDSEHPDYHVQPLVRRERIKPFLDASHNPLLCVRYFLFHFFTVLMSLFSIIVKFRIWKPLGLSSERLEFISRHSVTSVLSVTLLSRMIVCLANVLT